MSTRRRPDPLADLGRAVLTVLTDPASWKPGPTREIMAALAPVVARDARRPVPKAGPR